MGLIVLVLGIGVIVALQAFAGLPNVIAWPAALVWGWFSRDIASWVRITYAKSLKNEQISIQEEKSAKTP